MHLTNPRSPCDVPARDPSNFSNPSDSPSHCYHYYYYYYYSIIKKKLVDFYGRIRLPWRAVQYSVGYDNALGKLCEMSFSAIRARWRCTNSTADKTNFPRELIGALTFKLCPAIYNITPKYCGTRNRNTKWITVIVRFGIIYSNNIRHEITRIYKYYNTIDKFKYSQNIWLNYFVT